jgi:hypothetical protein
MLKYQHSGVLSNVLLLFQHFCAAGAGFRTPPLVLLCGLAAWKTNIQPFIAESAGSVY